MRIRHVAILAACLGIWVSFAWAQASPPDVCVVVSKEIRPFVMMADELESVLKFPVTRVYLDDDNQPYEGNGKFLDFLNRDFALFIAVGPRALAYLLEQKVTTRIIYGMVLNPESFVKADDNHVSGMSLNIFSLTQLSYIKKIFPDINRIGVLYDPEHNQNWFSSARLFANTRQIDLVPLAVSDRSEITTVLDKRAREVDAVLFIPDATVISTTIIQHVIKRLILKKIPTIGYNRFFTEAGSAMSFAIDYGKMGRQVANLAHDYLNEKTIIPVGHLFNVRLNTRVIDLLGLQLNTSLPENIEFVE